MPRKTVYLGCPPKRWVIVRKNIQVNDGLCEYDTRTLVLAKKLEGLNLLETAVHETLHAAMPDMAEHAVDRVAKQLVEVLVIISAFANQPAGG